MVQHPLLNALPPTRPSPLSPCAVPPPTGLVSDSSSTKLITSGLVARFEGQLGSDQAVRADAPVPNASTYTALRARAVPNASEAALSLSLSQVYYFEAHISSAAKGTDLEASGHRPPCVSIGLATRRFPLRRKQATRPLPPPRPRRHACSPPARPA